MRGFVILTVSVLIVIGAGVGLVGGLTYPQVPSSVYGHPPFRFSAAFPSAVLGGKSYLQCLSLKCDGTPVLAEWSALNDVYGAFVYRIDVSRPGGPKFAKLETPQDYRTHAVVHQGTTYLVGVTTCRAAWWDFGPGVCSDVVIVKKGSTIWIAGAASKTWHTLPKAFVQSFRVGG